MKNNNKVRLQSILKTVFPSVEGEFKEEWGANEIEEWDSMGHLNLVMMIGAEFEIDLNFEEVMAISTVGDVLAILEKKNFK